MPRSTQYEVPAVGEGETAESGREDSCGSSLVIGARITISSALLSAVASAHYICVISLPLPKSVSRDIFIHFTAPKLVVLKRGEKWDRQLDRLLSLCFHCCMNATANILYRLLLCEFISHQMLWFIMMV